MHFIVKSYLKNLFYGALLMAVAALVITCLIWFFWGLVIDQSFNFKECYRYTFILCFCFLLIYDTWWFVLGILKVKKLSKNLGLPFVEIAEGLYVYGFDKKQGFDNWDKGNFSRQLIIFRAAKKMKEAI